MSATPRRPKRDRSRSLSSEGSYERTLRNRNERSSRTSSTMTGGNRSMNSKKVYVSNITFDATIAELKGEFNSVGEVTYVQMLKDENGRFKGCAVISFKEPSMAIDAINSLNRQEFKGRKLVVKEEDANPDLKGPDRKRVRDEHDGRPLSNPANYNCYGLSLTFLESLKIDLPLVNIVFVANLDYTVDENNLKEIFSLAGKVMECEIFKDKEGKSRGFGIVEYEHPVEAVQAISMLHNQSYKDRMLTVRLDRSDRKKDSKHKLPPGLKSVGMGLGIDGTPLKDVKSLPAANPVGSLNHLSPVSSLNLGRVNSPVTSPINPGLGILDTVPPPPRFGLNSRGLSASLAGIGHRDYSSNPPPSSTYSAIGLGNIIEISNLPMDYTSENLRKLCWAYGEVRVAEMRSQGTGMVKYRTEPEAQRAVTVLDRYPFEGRMLSARVL